jgi:hypothetical protein
MKNFNKASIVLFLLICGALLFSFTSNNQFPVFPQSENKAWKTSVNTGIKPDTITMTGADTTVYQVYENVRGGRMSVITGLTRLSDTMTGVISLEGCNDNLGVTWVRLESTGITQNTDTLAFTNATSTTKKYCLESDYLKYRMRIRMTKKCKFVSLTNSAWKRYYFNSNTN